MAPSKQQDPPKSSRKQGESIKEKIHRHLRDKNDVITEEDIRDAYADDSYEKDSREKISDDVNDDTARNTNHPAVED